MRTQRGYGSFPTTFFTFSLLLLVLAAGFAVGRLVVGRAYIRSAGQFEKLPAPKRESSEAAVPESDRPVGQGYVPAPADQPERTAEKKEQTEGQPESPRPGAGEAGADSVADTPKAQESPEAPPPTENDKPPEDREKRYAIQVGLFEARDGAQKVADDLAAAGYPARVEMTAGEGGTVYRVLTGRYRTEYAARKAMDQLRQEGFSGFLVER